MRPEIKVKTDLTINESKRVAEILKKMSSPDPSTIVAELTGDDLKEFLDIVTEKPEGFDVGELKESEALEIFKDFFLSRIEFAKNTILNSRF